MTPATTREPTHPALRVLRHRWPLFALCGGLALVEALVLQLLGFRSALPLAPQVSAPASFAAYHDLRWVFTYSWSWLSVAWQLAALLAFRTVVSVAIVVLAWPGDVPRVPWPALVRRSLVVTVIAVLALAPWAGSAFAAQVVAFSWFMVLSIVAAAVTVLVLPLAVADTWWRRPFPWRSVAWVAVAWLAVTVEAVAVSLSPGWLAVITACGGGVVNAAIWLGLVHSVARAPRPRHRWPTVPVAIVAVLVVFLGPGGYLVGGAAAAPPTEKAPGTALTAAPDAQAVLYLPGYESSYDGRPYSLFSSDQLRTWHYSYRGLGPGGPLPYEPSRTHQSVEASVAALAEQVEWLADGTGEQVSLVAVSEGTLVARAYLATHPDAPVDRLVMASPLPRPARVYYPPAAEDGYGLLGGWQVRGLLALLRWENPDFTAEADMPLVRSVVENAGFFRPAMLCPAGPDVQSYALIPFAGATVTYEAPVSRIPWTALPGWHATLLPGETAIVDVERLLTTGRLSTHGPPDVAFRLISGAAAAWQIPALPLHLRDAWTAAPNSDPVLADWRCPDY